MMRTVVVALLTGIAAAAASNSSSPVTFNKDVLPVLQKNCQVCHRAGEVAPMAFFTYEETRPWAKAIKEAVVTKKMPPWFADPAFNGHFKNERRLTEQEISTLAVWADSGALEGDEKDKPAPAKFAEGWLMGEPDIVVEMAEEVQIPATGIVDVKSVFVKVNFPKDLWVEAAEIRPGNRESVHHMKAWVVHPAPPAGEGQSQPDDSMLGRRGGSREILVKYNPGVEPQFFTVGGAAKFIPAGSDIMFETHYTSNGKATTDKSAVGIKLAKAPPQKRFYTSGALTNHSFTIPARDPNWELKTEITIQEPVEIVWIQPHMHYRGKDYEVRAIYPTGETKTLLKVPAFRFDWQQGYEFVKPVALPVGTRLESIAHFDNSPNNPYNPDPNRDVPYGAESVDEMSVAFFSVITDPDSKPTSLIGRRARRAVETAQ
jgi:hypothetical protein